MKASIKAISPKGFEIQIEATDEDKADLPAWLLTMDSWLTDNGFKAMPVPTAGGYSGGAKPKPKGSLDYDDSKKKILIEIPFRGKWDNDAEKRKVNQREYSDGVLQRIQNATKQQAQLLTLELPDGKKKYLRTLPPNFAKMVAGVLPADEFEQTDAFKQLLEAQA